MRAKVSLKWVMIGTACLGFTGCNHLSGKPGPEPDVPRPEQVLDFHTLYRQNCAACHGDTGEHGAAISLSSPVYLAIAGESNVRNVIANGVKAELMPAFAKSAGGMLTDQQVAVLAHGLVSEWGKPQVLAGVTAPAYKAGTQGDAGEGQKVFSIYCARCHGETGQGAGRPGAVGSIVDPVFLGLTSDQYLRSLILAGVADQGMPDWLHNTASNGKQMTDAELTDLVTWLTSHRTPQQPADRTTAGQARQNQELHPHGPAQPPTQQAPI